MSLKSQAISGAFWLYMQQFGNQIVSFFISIILARLLTPAEFGLVGMITIFIALGNVLFDGGLTSSLIRTTSPTANDYSTVFFFNLAVSVVLYFLLFICAPFIAAFFKEPKLTMISRIYGVTFIFSAFGAVQNTILTSRLAFKKQSLITFPSLLIGSLVGVYLAYLNFGVWALVFYNLTSVFLTSLFLWIFSGWRPTLSFDRTKFIYHFRFGYKLTLSGALDVIFTNIYQLVIGKLYTPDVLGYYSRAQSLMMLPVSNISNVLNKLAFPLFSKVQHDNVQLKAYYRQIMMIVLFIVTPILVLMAVLCNQLILVLFGKKWLPMVPIFQIIAFTGVLYPIHLYNLIILQVKGRSDLFLKLEVVKKILTTCVLLVSLIFGFYGLLWGQLLFSILALIINTHYAGKMLDYSTKSQLRDLMPIFLLGAFVGVVAYLLALIIRTEYPAINLLAVGLITSAVYLIGARQLKFESFFKIIQLIKK